MKKLLLLVMIIILSFSVFADVEYNFLTANQINTQTTNTSTLVQGFSKTTKLIIGDVNGTVKQLNLTDNTVSTLTGFNPTCLRNPTSNNSFLIVFNDNSSICDFGTGTSYTFSTNGVTNVSYTSSGSFSGLTNNGSSIFYYTNGGNPFAFNKKTFPALTSYPALACYNDLYLAFYNNFGVNLTANGGLNQTFSSGTLIQSNDTFYFKVGNHWYFLEENGASTCTGIANTLNLATITLPTITTTNNRYIIINDYLYINSKDGNQFYAFTSGDVNVYEGITCNSDRSICVQINSSCIYNPIYTGSEPTTNLWCNNTLVSDTPPYYYCLDYTNSTYCTDGCTETSQVNVYGINYNTGTCNQLTTCTNECLITGVTYSPDITSTATCEFNSDTGCLHYVIGYCNTTAGEASVDGVCYTTNNTGTITTLKGFNVYPIGTDDSSDVNNAYVLSNPPKLDISSKNIVVQEYFQTSTSVYPYQLSRICNYTNTVLYNDVTPKNINTSQEVNISTYTNGILKLDLVPLADTGVLIESFDIIGRKGYGYYLERNTSHGTCLWVVNDTSNKSFLQGCSINSGDLVQNIGVQIQTLNGASSVYLNIKRTNTLTNTLYTSFLNNLNPLTTDFYTFRLTGTYYISKIEISNDAQNNQISYTTLSVPISNNTNRCIFTDTGCRMVRSYYTNHWEENLFNYKDWYVCVNRLGDLTITTTSNSLLGKLNDNAKLILSLVIPMIVLIVFLAFGFTTRRENEQTAIIWAGILVTIVTFILFAVFGWLPVWILIVAGIIASLGVGLFFVNKTRGQ